MSHFPSHPPPSNTSSPGAPDPSWESFLQEYAMPNQHAPNHEPHSNTNADALRALMNQSNAQNTLESLAELASSEPRLSSQQLDNSQLLQAIMGLIGTNNSQYPPGPHPGGNQPVASTSYSAPVPQHRPVSHIHPHQLSGQGHMGHYPDPMAPPYPWVHAGESSSTGRNVEPQPVRPQVTVGVPNPRSVSAEPVRSASSTADETRPRRARATSSVSAADGVDVDAQRASIAEEKRRRNTAASARFRNKKKSQILSLERTISDLTGRAEDLEREAADLRRENGWLKEIIILKGKTMAGQTPQFDGKPQEPESSSKASR